MRDIKDVQPEFITECPTGELTIIEGPTMSGKTLLACRMFMHFLQENPKKRAAFISSEETRDEVIRRCAALPDVDLKALDRGIHVQVSPTNKSFDNFDNMDLTLLGCADCIIYDTIYKYDGVMELVEEFPNALHIGLFQAPRTYQQR